eukprot:4804685-Alexandrium_andersonii.AAC.1
MSASLVGSEMCIRDSPFVTSSTSTVVPVALYMDGVKYSNVDSVTGIWTGFPTTGARRLCGLVRKKICCKC